MGYKFTEDMRLAFDKLFRIKRLTVVFTRRFLNMGMSAVMKRRRKIMQDCFPGII